MSSIRDVLFDWLRRIQVMLPPHTKTFGVWLSLDMAAVNFNGIWGERLSWKHHSFSFAGIQSKWVCSTESFLTQLPCTLKSITMPDEECGRHAGWILALLPNVQGSCLRRCMFSSFITFIELVHVPVIHQPPALPSLSWTDDLTVQCYILNRIKCFLECVPAVAYQPLHSFHTSNVHSALPPVEGMWKKTQVTCNMYRVINQFKRSKRTCSVLSQATGPLGRCARHRKNLTKSALSHMGT